MKNIKIRCLLYVGTIISSITVLGLIYEFTGYSWSSILSTIIFWLAIVVMLVDIGVSIKKEHVKKKYIVYSSLFIGQVVIMQLISMITGVATYNTWLGSIGISIIFVTIVIMLNDITKSMKRNNIYITYGLRLTIYIVIIAIIINNIILFVGGWHS